MDGYGIEMKIFVIFCYLACLLIKISAVPQRTTPLLKAKLAPRQISKTAQLINFINKARSDGGSGFARSGSYDRFYPYKRHNAPVTLGLEHLNGWIGSMLGLLQPKYESDSEYVQKLRNSIRFHLIDNPEVLEKYQRSLMKDRSSSSSESEDDSNSITDSWDKKYSTIRRNIVNFGFEEPEPSIEITDNPEELIQNGMPKAMEKVTEASFQPSFPDDDEATFPDEANDEEAEKIYENTEKEDDGLLTVINSNEFKKDPGGFINEKNRETKDVKNKNDFRADSLKKGFGDDFNSKEAFNSKKDEPWDGKKDEDWDSKTEPKRDKKQNEYAKFGSWEGKNNQWAKQNARTERQMDWQRDDNEKDTKPKKHTNYKSNERNKDDEAWKKKNDSVEKDSGRLSKKDDWNKKDRDSDDNGKYIKKYGKDLENDDTKKWETNGNRNQKGSWKKEEGWDNKYKNEDEFKDLINQKENKWDKKDKINKKFPDYDESSEFNNKGNSKVKKHDDWDQKGEGGLKRPDWDRKHDSDDDTYNRKPNKKENGWQKKENNWNKKDDDWNKKFYDRKDKDDWNKRDDWNKKDDWNKRNDWNKKDELNKNEDWNKKDEWNKKEDWNKKDEWNKKKDWNKKGDWNKKEDGDKKHEWNKKDNDWDKKGNDWDKKDDWDEKGNVWDKRENVKNKQKSEWDTRDNVRDKKNYDWNKNNDWSKKDDRNKNDGWNKKEGWNKKVDWNKKDDSDEKDNGWGKKGKTSDWKRKDIIRNGKDDDWSKEDGLNIEDKKDESQKQKSDSKKNEWDKVGITQQTTKPEEWGRYDNKKTYKSKEKNVSENRETKPRKNHDWDNYVPKIADYYKPKRLKRRESYERPAHNPHDSFSVFGRTPIPFAGKKRIYADK